VPERGPERADTFLFPIIEIVPLRGMPVAQRLALSGMKCGKVFSRGLADVKRVPTALPAPLVEGHWAQAAAVLDEPPLAPRLVVEHALLTANFPLVALVALGPAG